MNFSIKKRIYPSFYLLASLFVINGLIIVITLNYNQKLSKHLSKVADPSVQSIYDFRQIIHQSQMFSTNWVFIRSSEEDKEALKKLHATDFPSLKIKLDELSANWYNQQMKDSLKNIFSRFEELMLHDFMRALTKFEDYDDVVKRFAAEEIIENDVLPHTRSLMNSIGLLLTHVQQEKAAEEKKLENSAIFMRALILILAVSIIGLAVFLSRYMGKIIIRPINGIICIVNDLGKGVTSRINHFTKNDEIGEMIYSVNSLSEKLHSSALFANEIGNRNFDTEFAPLGEEDKLGKALIAMRDNLKSTDESLNEAQHIAHLGSWEWDIKNNKISWSDEFYRLFDLELHEHDAPYKGYLTFVHPEDREHANSLIAKCLQDHEPFSYECRIVTKKGAVKIIYAQGKVFLNGQGEVIKMYGIGQDITEQKQAQLALQNAHREMQTLFKNIDDVFFSMDMIECKLLQMSPACEKVYGYSSTEFFKNPMLWLDVTLDEDKDIIKTNETDMRAGKSIQHESRIRHRDKSVHWIETKITPTLNGKGILVRIDGLVSDITERKKAKISLLESEEQIKTIYNAVLDAVIIIDEEGRIVKWDVKSEALFGWKEEEVMGRLLSEKIIPHENREAHERGMKHFLKTGVGPLLGRTIEVRALNKNNQLIDISLSISPSLVKDKYQFIGFVRDITSRKEAEKNLEQQNKELLKTNSELDKFVYSVSHDLRAPLLSMLGIVEISEEESTDAFIQENLGFLKGSIKKLDGFVKDILEYSRNARTEVKNQEINFKEMLTEITGNLKYMGGNKTRQVDIKFEIKNPKLFNSDKNRISILLNNLISNAIRYQDPLTDNPFVNIQIDMSDTETGIIVRDNGIGISKENQKKIFDMFYRVSENSVGSGLGLYLVKEIIEKLNGEIKVESEIGKGTSFSVNLPN